LDSHSTTNTRNGIPFANAERTRDVLLAHSYLTKYQTLQLEDRSKENKLALESLHLGVSYARSTKDPIARAIAEECISGLDVAL
jgi:hypothetical protein